MCLPYGQVPSPDAVWSQKAHHQVLHPGYLLEFDGSRYGIRIQLSFHYPLNYHITKWGTPPFQLTFAKVIQRIAADFFSALRQTGFKREWAWLKARLR